MNNKIKAIILAIITPVILVLFMGAAPQVSSVTETTERLADGLNITKITWTADSTGVVPATSTTAFFRGIIKQIITVPDTPLVPAIEDSSGRGPSVDYDITLMSNLNIDAATGTLIDRHTSNTEREIPLSGALSAPFINNSKLTTTITNNIIPNARGRIYIYWWEK